MDFPYLKGQKANMFSPLALAYVGDAVYEVYVRTKVLEGGNTPVNKLHKTSTGYVSARAQSKIAHMLEPHLTPEEEAVYKRGRNAHSNTIPKNASVADYKKATAFEALIGYLFLKNDINRLEYIVNIAFNDNNQGE